MSGSRWRQRIAPWKWMPLIIFLTLQLRLSDLVHIAGPYLIIPIGAHLARRYGRAGFSVIALSGLPLLGQVSLGTVVTTSDPGIYLSALLISWFLQTDPPVYNKFPQLRLSPWVLISLFFLPLHIGLGSSDILWFDNVRWIWDGVTLFYLLVFVLGLSRAAMQPVIIALTLAAFFGVMLEFARLPVSAAQWLEASRAELPWFGLTDLSTLYASYRFDSPADLLTAFGFLLFGRFLADQHCRDALILPSPMHRSGLISAVLLLALGGQINDYLLPSHNPALQWLGSFHAILLVGMLAGFYFRFAGILWLLLLMTSFWWIDAVLRADLNIIQPRFYFSMDDLLYTYGFGLLGIGMRDIFDHTSTRLWHSGWFRYLGFYLLVVFSVTPLKAPYDLFIILMAFFAGIVVTLGINRIRDRLTKTKIVVTGGWLSLACLIMMSYLVYHFGKENWQGLQKALQQAAGMVEQLVSAKKAMDEEDLMMVGFVAGGALTVFWLLTSTLADLMKSINKLTADLRGISKHLRSKAPIMLKLHWRKNAAPANGPGRFLLCLSNTLTWTHRALLAAIISLFILLATYNAWVDYQNDLAREVRFRDTPALPSEEMLQQRKEDEKAREDVVARLTLGTQGVLKDYPNVKVHRDEYRMTITSSWHTTANEPSVRRRVYVTIRLGAELLTLLSEKSLGQSINVTLYRQDRGHFNLWVEHSPNPYWEDERALENALKQAIVRAVIVEPHTNNQHSGQK